MSAAAILYDDLPPGINFVPSDDQLIELYLLPRVRGQADPFPGLIVEDDTAANTQPWKLFHRHDRPNDLPAFFYVRTNDARAGARPDRRCHGGGSWKSQKRESEDASHELLVDGERIKWTRHSLNLNMGSGSVGWVMHEYTITDRPYLKICRISFTGHGQKRKRVPDGYDDDCLAADGAVAQRPRVAAEADDSACAASSSSGRTATAFAQDFEDPMQNLSEEEIAEMMDELIDAQPNWRCEEEQFMPTDGEPYPYLYQQRLDKARTTTMEQKVDQDAVPHMDSMATGGQGIVIWDGIDFY